MGLQSRKESNTNTPPVPVPGVVYSSTTVLVLTTRVVLVHTLLQNIHDWIAFVRVPQQ